MPAVNDFARIGLVSTKAEYRSKRRVTQIAINKSHNVSGVVSALPAPASSAECRHQCKGALQRDGWGGGGGRKPFCLFAVYWEYPLALNKKRMRGSALISCLSAAHALQHHVVF